MGKDYRTGLMTGVVLAGAALIWVATRPSLGPQTRIVPDAANGERWIREAGDSFPASDAPSHTPENVAADWPPVPQPLPLPEYETVRRQQERAIEPSDLLTLSPSSQEGQPDLTIYEQSEPIKTTRFHIVRRGESLSTIARDYYGSADQWHKILAANRQTIKDANKITPGTKLIIPE